MQKKLAICSYSMYWISNYFLHTLHLLIILLSISLCFFSETQKIHLLLQGSILFSWVILGPLINKPGMCLITEIQKKLNNTYRKNFPNSYMVLIYQKLGVNINNMKKADLVTFSVFIVTTLVSITSLILSRA